MSSKTRTKTIDNLKKVIDNLKIARHSIRQHLFHFERKWSLVKCGEGETHSLDTLIRTEEDLEGEESFSLPLSLSLPVSLSEYLLQALLQSLTTQRLRQVIGVREGGGSNRDLKNIH